jgi:hypothetical protein
MECDLCFLEDVKFTTRALSSAADSSASEAITRCSWKLYRQLKQLAVARQVAETRHRELLRASNAALCRAAIRDATNTLLQEDTKAGDTLSSRHVSSHKTYVLFATPSLSLPLRWLSYADLYNLVPCGHIKRSVDALFQ